MKTAFLIFAAVFYCTMVFADGNPRQLRMLISAKRSLEKSDESRSVPMKCRGAKCNCLDFDLLSGFVGTKPEKRQGYNFYEEGCSFMEQIGAEYEAGTSEEEVYSCCEVKEGLVAFHCLNTYMTLAEMQFARGVLNSTGKVRDTAKLVEQLEMGVRHQCDSLFANPNCLVMGMTENPDVESCAARPSPPPKQSPPLGTERPKQSSDKPIIGRSEEIDRELGSLLKMLLEEQN